MKYVIKMKIPTREECFKLLKKYGTFDNVIDHSIQVNKISVFLAKKLKQNGEEVNIDLVDRASLLHDVAKTMEIKDKNRKSGAQHGEVGYDILVKEGYPEIAKITRKHVLLKTPETLEEKIVHYSDSRILHNKIVSIDERLNDLKVRYAKFKGAVEEIERTRLQLKKLEKELFDKIKIEPKDLGKMIK
jgi:putative nucleotidyltransferase with HDIG domain